MADSIDRCRQDNDAREVAGLDARDGTTASVQIRLTNGGYLVVESSGPTVLSHAEFALLQDKMDDAIQAALQRTYSECTRPEP